MSDPLKPEGIAPAPSPASKPGPRTSEFWITLGVQIILAVCATGIIKPNTPAESIISLLLMVASALGYQVNRNALKKDRQDPPPGV